LKHRPITKNLG